ncbi:MAG: hypothetical protein WBD95_17530 [Xanthobacteraceae bacterium]
MRAKIWKQVTDFINPSIGAAENELLIGTPTDIYGYGFANVAVGISVEHFRALADAMMAANPEEATKAFGHALEGGTTQRQLQPLDIRKPDWKGALAAAKLIAEERIGSSL